MILVWRCGTTMSPSEGLSRRLTTMLFRRRPTVTITPAGGETGTSTPPRWAISPAHGPVALTTSSAPMVSDLPVRKSRTFTPVTAPPERTRSVTSAKVRTTAPFFFAVARKAMQKRQGSKTPSGTCTAASSLGFRQGSSRSASVGVRTR